MEILRNSMEILRFAKDLLGFHGRSQHFPMGILSGRGGCCKKDRKRGKAARWGRDGTCVTRGQEDQHPRHGVSGGPHRLVPFACFLLLDGPVKLRGFIKPPHFACRRGLHTVMGAACGKAGVKLITDDDAPALCIYCDCGVRPDRCEHCSSASVASNRYARYIS